MLKRSLIGRSVREGLSSWDYIIHLNTILIVMGALYFVYEFQHEFLEIRAMMLSSMAGTVFFYFTMVVLAFKVVFLIYLLSRYVRYRPIPSVSDAELPYCTVIVPAFNEGRLVYDTLRSVADSDYPKDRIQLIAIDDGSNDDTYAWMQQAKAELGGFLSICQQPENMGKRHALYRGFKLATGEVLVTIDSDSIVDSDTLRNLVSPFVTDPDCGAVAGNVRVLNRRTAIIPKMLNVSFAFSFGFIRSAQSTLGSVLCTPGALSAYRRVAVMNCLEEWVRQTFLGVRTDIGEDRAMTNMILKQGYHVLFQSNALVHTNIPETYRTLRKMFTRWERSNVRENVMMGKFAFTRFREGPMAGPRLLLINQWLTIIAAYPSLIAMLIMIVMHPLLFISSMISSVFIFSCIPAAYFALRHNLRKSIWIFSYNIFYSFSLFWITPYAIVTASRRGWLTR